MDDFIELPDDVVECFKILGMRPNTYRSIEDVRRKFKELAIQIHPDKSNSPEAKENFQNLNNAYEKLTIFYQSRLDNTKSVKGKAPTIYNSLGLEYRNAVNNENVVVRKLPSLGAIEGFRSACVKLYGHGNSVQDGVKYVSDFKFIDDEDYCLGNIFVTVYNSGTVMCQGLACLLWHACHLPFLVSSILPVPSNEHSISGAIKGHIMLGKTKQKNRLQKIKDVEEVVEKEEEEQQQQGEDGEVEGQEEKEGENGVGVEGKEEEQEEEEEKEEEEMLKNKGLKNKNVVEKDKPSIELVIDRIDKLEMSMANLIGILSSDKINLVREATSNETELLKERHKAAINSLRQDIKRKDMEISKKNGELSELKKLVRKKEDERKEELKMKDIDISKMNGEISDLKKLIRKNEDKKKGELLAKDNKISILNGEIMKVKEKFTNLEKDTKLWKERALAKHEISINTNQMLEQSYAKSVSKQTSPTTTPKKHVAAEENDEVPLNDGWQTVYTPKFRNPDVLIVGNSNIRELHPKFLKPLFVKKHLLHEKTLRGAAEYLKKTDVKPSKYIVVQAIDNDVNEVPTKEIISTINVIKNVCESRFPDVKLFLMEPLGRCTSIRPRLYWDKATGLCSLLSSLEGIDIIKIPARLKKADATLFYRERDGYIHLNRSGIGALSNVYRDTLLVVDRKTDSPDQMRGRNVSDVVKTSEVEPDRFGLLVQTLIKGLSSFT